MKKFVLVGLLSALLFPLVSHAQGLGSILGTVTDPSGAAIASAKITVTQAGHEFFPRGYFQLRWLLRNLIAQPGRLFADH
jgi:hypothetical protein